MGDTPDRRFKTAKGLFLFGMASCNMFTASKWKIAVKILIEIPQLKLARNTNSLQEAQSDAQNALHTRHPIVVE